ASQPGTPLLSGASAHSHEYARPQTSTARVYDFRFPCTYRSSSIAPNTSGAAAWTGVASISLHVDILAHAVRSQMAAEGDSGVDQRPSKCPGLLAQCMYPCACIVARP